MKIKSFAKINLGLEVLGKRSDGYHDIRTLFQSVSLYDELEAETLEDERIVISGTGENIPWDRSNLICQAARLLQKQFAVGKGAFFRVKKNIPPGKGLGGGSSNAAMVLFFLNKLWDIKADPVTINEIARQIGADVPYFLRGGLCLGTERGDVVSPLQDKAGFYCLLIFPEFRISTHYIYQQHLSCSLTSDYKDSKIIRFLAENKFSILENDLEETVFRSHPQLADMKQTLLSQGAELSMISGTGSTVFGIFLSRQQAARAREKLGQAWHAVIVEPVDRTRYWEECHAGV
ncbi:MAG: 4-(cytidine 5'-diphospho)-2-C-methyl-D-erythritol kinase [Acidobacteriota bacterium]